jgi:heat shock protein HslJ/membrane-bound inhibitor of C-type lysozyme
MFQRHKKSHTAPFALPYFLIATVAVYGCNDGAPTVATEASAMPHTLELTGTRWQVEDIDAGGVIDNSHVTIEIPESGRIAGSSGCNRYFGSVVMDTAGFQVSVAGSTKRACGPALDAQEHRVLQALLDVRRWESDGTVLQLFDAEGKARIRAVAMDEPGVDEPVPNDRPAEFVDPASVPTPRFRCDEALDVSVRFLGPETLQISLPDGKHVLEREPAASGARYSGDGILFWNKGDEALLNIGGVEHHCVKI